MKMIARLLKIIGWALAHLKDAAYGIENAMFARRARLYSQAWSGKDQKNVAADPQMPNRLRTYFDANTEGHGIFKLHHYFDVYERHFRKFVGKEVHIVEIGVYSGGSLKMGRDYFGDKCTVYGVDILEECRTYESDGIKILIGDQADREFWNKFREKVPRVDIIVDDGGHQAEQQIVTLEEMLPYIAPGGIYLCEDVSGSRMKLTAYVNGLQNELNHIDPSGERTFKASVFQQQIGAIHQYPYIFVIEKRGAPLPEFVAEMRGTIWNPYHH